MDKREKEEIRDNLCNTLFLIFAVTANLIFIISTDKSYERAFSIFGIAPLLALAVWSGKKTIESMRGGRK